MLGIDRCSICSVTCYLVAPVFHLNQWQREVYLPEGTWRDTRDEKTMRAVS